MDLSPDIRQNFDSLCESGINKQINLQLHASYVYLAMAYHFDRADVALEGFQGYCKKLSDRRREVASQWMAYQNQRGGKIFLQDIKSLNQHLVSSQSAMEVALSLEKEINQAILDLSQLADCSHDAELSSVIGNYLEEGTTLIKEIGDHLANMERVGPNLGEFMFDKETLSS